ncbi:MAG: SUMF1/EgtB/PvdO family nonheme iron enzyme [Anaerolineales bacterium]|nr:SUMF1/EgtB/PvdO family nonheme iron enzyme [Anaerolineales bacterium]
MNYYELLDVAPEATQAEIKAAYRIQVQLHHPDRLQQANETVRRYAEDKLKRINEAYTVLSDPVRRSAYDARWRAEQSRARSAAAREPEGAEGDWFASRPAGTRRRRSEAQAAREWMKWEAEMREAERFAERQRQAAAAEAQARQAAEERARQGARTRYPRPRRDGDHLLVTLQPGLTLTLLRIPPGEFLMGSDPARDALAQPAERPQHVVRLSEFFIAQTPLTHAGYQAFQQAAHPNTPWTIPDGQALHPVANVSWDDALAFCRWLDAPGWKFRLPTEAEWEKAARGADGRLFPWGNVWEPGRANIDDAAAGTTPVGLFSPGGDSPYGLTDVCGNVWEWCADWYDAAEYAQRETILDPGGPEAGEGVVVRGGAFDAPLKRARSAQRNWDYPFKRRPNTGFRVVATPVAEDERR